MKNQTMIKIEKDTVEILKKLRVVERESYNEVIKRILEDYLEDIKLRKVEEFGIPSDAKEALSFAILANETICGNPGNVPSATGAKERVVLGKIIPGR